MPIVMGFLVLILCSTCAIKMFSPPQTAQQQAESKKRQESDDAKRMAKEFVREKAKLPATAEFAPLKDFQVKTLGSGVYEISAFVETPAENGSKKRSNFVCELKKNGYKWELVQLDMPR
ncbi:hypothetical protein LPW11_00960 [Geomonas sp. RF6]|uniref:hypothetical protein n=1 Tax=Geomonas sp. RF6 TaxID=2897342 RepID=UPI001E5FE10F|nr:hypothetical protein [Geomonas sp. RF6]UFS70773.1 hypothetical protein LPW11_00960 [Geomonas sp. RF6]